MIIEKICTKCNEPKSLDDFHKNSHNKDGLQSQCRDCRNASKREWNRNNQDKVKEYREKTKDKHRERVRKARKKGRWAKRS